MFRIILIVAAVALGCGSPMNQPFFASDAEGLASGLGAPSWKHEVVRTGVTSPTGMVLAGDKLIWGTMQGVFRCDLEGGSQYACASGNDEQLLEEAPARAAWDSDGAIIAWRNDDNIYSYDIDTGGHATLFAGGTTHMAARPRVSEGVVVWAETNRRTLLTKIVAHWHPRAGQVVPPNRVIFAGVLGDPLPLAIVSIHKGRVVFTGAGESRLLYCNLRGVVSPCDGEPAEIPLPGIVSGGIFQTDDVLMVTLNEPGAIKSVYAYSVAGGYGGFLAHGAEDANQLAADTSTSHLFWLTKTDNPFDSTGILESVSLVGKRSRVTLKKNAGLVGRTDCARVPWTRSPEGSPESWELVLSRPQVSTLAVSAN